MRKQYIRLIIAFVTLLLAVLYSFNERFQQGIQSSNADNVKVVKVHDGDTISVIFNNKAEKVRLIGIDAPELKQKYWGLKAKKRIEDILNSNNWMISLEFDIEPRDKYGRLLCYAFTSDKRMINLQMLQDGYAMLFTVPPNVRYVKEFKNAQHEAREHKLGIWGERGLKERPFDYRKKHPRV